jgi:hypothetical protein
MKQDAFNASTLELWGIKFYQYLYGRMSCEISFTSIYEPMSSEALSFTSICMNSW